MEAPGAGSEGPGTTPPWDLLYCQNMLTMCLCQMQQWEQYRYQLALHLQGAAKAEQEQANLAQLGLSPHTAAVVDAMIKDQGIVHVAITCEVDQQGLRQRQVQQQPQQQPLMQQQQQAAAAVAQAAVDARRLARDVRALARDVRGEARAPDAEAAAQEAGAEDGGPEAARFRGLQAIGYDLMFILKGAVFLFICECTPFVLCVYGTFACLYLAGAFNFAKRWFQGWARRPQLEVHLVRLREQQHADAGAAGRPPDAAVPPDGAAPPEGAERGADGREPLVPAAQEPPPFWARYVYQLVVMYIMTMLPWWTPDERYLV